MDWLAIRKLRASRIYDQQSFKLHRPLPKRGSSHRAKEAFENIEASKATEAAVSDDGSQFRRSGLSGKSEPTDS